MREPVAYQIGGSELISRPSLLYAAAMAVKMQWQSIRLARMPPLTTCAADAVWNGWGVNELTDSSPSQ